MQQPPSKLDEQVLQGGFPAGELVSFLGEPRPAENKSGMVQNLILKAAASGVPLEVIHEGSVRVNMEMPRSLRDELDKYGVSPEAFQKMAAVESADNPTPLGGTVIIDEAHMPRDVQLPESLDSSRHHIGTIRTEQPPTVSVSPGVIEYEPPVFEVEGHFIPESGVIPVYGEGAVVIRKHPSESWSVHWLYQGQMSWIPFTRMPRASMSMIELHLQDANVYPREAHEWARLCTHEPHKARAQLPAPPAPQLTWTQKRKLAAGKQAKKGRQH